MSIKVVVRVTALLCLSQIGNINATDLEVHLPLEVRHKIVEFYNTMIPQMPEDNTIRQGFEIVRELLTKPVEQIDGDKIAQFVKILVNPVVIIHSIQTLHEDQKKQILNFYNDIIPQMPEKDVLRMRYEQWREMMTHPDEYSVKEFSLSEDVRKEFLDFHIHIIPQMPEGNLIRQIFEVGRDLQIQPDKVTGERIRTFLHSLITHQKVRENIQALTPEVRKKFLDFLDSVIPKISEKNIFRLRFEQSRDELKSVIDNSKR